MFSLINTKAKALGIALNFRLSAKGNAVSAAIKKAHKMQCYLSFADITVKGLPLLNDSLFIISSKPSALLQTLPMKFVKWLRYDQAL